MDRGAMWRWSRISLVMLALLGQGCGVVQAPAGGAADAHSSVETIADGHSNAETIADGHSNAETIADVPHDEVPHPCIPDCQGKVCGDDGCGGSCGSCSDGEYCQDGACKCLFGECVGSCCADGEVCFEGACCMPECTGMQCDQDDGCGGSCNACGDGYLCEAGVCVCQVQCGDECCMPGFSCSDGACVCDDMCGQICCQPDELCMSGSCCPTF